jgi:uncharacterized membrane protein
VIRFATPWLLGLGLPLAAVVAWRLRRLPSDYAGARRRVVQSLMLSSVVAVALALAGLEWGTRLDRMAVVFAVDRSRSVERAGDSGATRALEQVRRATAAMRPDDKAGLVVFGAEAATEVVPSPNPPIGGARATIARDATDLAAAIRRALADLPAEHAGRIVLLSDGVETRGDALEAATLAAGRGVQIDVLPIERAAAPEVAIESVRLPERADPREPIELRVVTRATRATEVDVRVMRDGEPIAVTRTRVRPGDDVLTMRDVATEPGVHRYDVLVEPVDPGADTARENNEGGAYVRVSGGARVLLLAERPPEVEALAGAIRAAGFEVDVRDRTGVPADLGTLASYDLLVLADIDARSFSTAGLAQIQSYVRDLGGGLLMTGTRDSFGLGGYAYTPVEEALPATFDLRKRRDRASLAMVIAIDKSGSMGVEVSPGNTKLDVANEAAARSAMLLSPFDHVGVAHVDTSVEWSVTMRPVEDPAQIAAQVRRATVGGGGILIDLSLEASYEVLRREGTQLKHLLLFADGSDAEEMGGARSLVERAARDHITTSIVAMGNGPDTPELEQLTRLGGGRFYIVEDLTELPRIFTQETIEASRSAIVDHAFRALPGADAAATRGIDFAEAPALGGYVVMNARGRAQRLLGATREDPLLLVWQHGIGRSATFATDAGSGFARTWLGWSGYHALFGQLSRDLSRSPERRDAQVFVTMSGGKGRVRVEAVDAQGRYRNYLELSATIAGPDGRPMSVHLEQTGAGRYEASFDADAPGAYLVTVSEAARGLVGSAGIVRPAGDELRGEGTDRAKLAQIAALTGGRVLTSLASTFRVRPPPVYAFAPLWSALVMSALLMLLASVAVRRLVLPPDLLRRMLPARLRRALRIAAPRVESAASEATLAALAAARARGRTTKDADVAPELRAAQSAQPTSGAAPRPRTQSDDATGKAAGAPPAAPKEPAPQSLGEKLLERRKKR